MDKKIVKIIIPICIVIAVVAIWFLKNADKGSEPLISPTEGSDLPISSTGESMSGNLVAQENEGDFSLEAASIDLKALTSYGIPIIIDFGADSCDPCKKMAPVLTKMNTEMQGKAIIKFVDVWKNGAAANDFPIQVIPTQVFINADGTPYVPSDDIDIIFDMYSYKDTGEHAFTVHQGGLTEEQMRTILADMGVTS